MLVANLIGFRVLISLKAKGFPCAGCPQGNRCQHKGNDDGRSSCLLKSYFAYPWPCSGGHIANVLDKGRNEQQAGDRRTYLAFLGVFFRHCTRFVLEPCHVGVNLKMELCVDCRNQEKARKALLPAGYSCSIFSETAPSEPPLYLRAIKRLLHRKALYPVHLPCERLPKRSSSRRPR